MIDPLDLLLRDLIQSRVPRLAALTQVGFAPPNNDWRTAVATGGEERLNCYLYDLRENIALRTNERRRETTNGWYAEHRAPPRLDCRYLLTAWSPVATTPAIEATRDEHTILSEVLAPLMRHRPLVAERVYQPGIAIPSGRTLASVPDGLKGADLPAEVASPQDLPNPGEFWQGMGVSWRPGIRLTVTIPVLLAEPAIESPMVTTLTATSMVMDRPETAAARLTIGGHVRASTAAGAGAVRGAWVQIVGLDPVEVRAVDARMVTGADGRFRFDLPGPGRYRLRAVASGQGDLPREVDVPAGSGEYDLQFP